MNNTNASRIPAAQHEGSLFAVFVIFVCLFVSLRKRTTKKKATSHRKDNMQKNSRYGFYNWYCLPNDLIPEMKLSS